jgi:hypothetical protein
MVVAGCGCGLCDEFGDFLSRRRTYGIKKIWIFFLFVLEKKVKGTIKYSVAKEHNFES